MWRDWNSYGEFEISIALWNLWKMGEMRRFWGQREDMGT